MVGRAVALLLCFCALGGCQSTNLTLFKIFPCGGVVNDTVSRFKSDIYAVEIDFRYCNISIEPGDDDTKIGFRVVSWAHISISDYVAGNQDPVVFIARQGSSGVVSWNSPLKPQGFSRYFQHINRTMCPDNNTAGDFLFYVDVFSSSKEPVPYSIGVETVPHFILELDEPIVTTVSASSPQIQYFKFPEGVSTVTVEATTDSDRCAFVSVQNNTCPINDLLENAYSRGLYQTMSKSAVLTVEANQVKDREFVLVIITTNYSICHGSKYAPLERIVNGSSAGSFAYAQDIKVLVSTLKPTSHFVLAILFPFLVFLLYLALVCLYIFTLPRVYVHFEKINSRCCCCPRIEPKFPWSCKDGLSFSNESVQEYDSLESTPNSGLSIQCPVADAKSNGESTTTACTSSPLEESLTPIQEPDEQKLMLPLMYRSKYYKLNKQYTIYSWNTITVGIFYALPAFQLVLSEQQILNTTGDQDKCYFNFKCSHPLGVLSVFNSVWSNVGYFLLGILFLILVTARKSVYMNRLKDSKRAESHGIPQFYGIYQAMGIALVLEGFMSAFYHICPTDANFQFDTAFMYILGGLFLVKLFQNRHPDINANAFIAFFSFAVVIFTTLIGIYFDRRNPIAVRFTIFFFVLIFVFIFFLSFYKFHSLSLDIEWLRVEFRKKCGEFFCGCPQHKCRFFKFSLIFGFNVGMALIVIFYNKLDIATGILGLFVVNLMLFLLTYLTQKLYYMETITILPVFLAATAVALWACAFYFFIIRASTNWQYTPAESREMNSPCILLGFYDAHDIWHFFSASALFFSFLFLLTLDDGLQFTRRDKIHIF